MILENHNCESDESACTLILMPAKYNVAFAYLGPCVIYDLWSVNKSGTIAILIFFQVLAKHPTEQEITLTSLT